MFRVCEFGDFGFGENCGLAVVLVWIGVLFSFEIAGVGLVLCLGMLLLVIRRDLGGLAIVLLFG